jgi:hypothetical protein
VSSKPLSRASGLALFMLAAGKPDRPVGWTIVAREIALLASELGRVHLARGELARAQEIETELGPSWRTSRRHSSASGPHWARTSTPKRKPPNAHASRWRPRHGIPDNRAPARRGRQAAD